INPVDLCFREVAVPIYEYQCESCGHKFEAIQRISEAPLRDCPECNQADLKKLISAAGFRLKGGGWYETDFKSGGKKKNLVGDKAGSEKSEKSDKAEKSGGTESAPGKTEKSAS
ncbi:MAG: FmdB family zinc ribbon protein, partial [Gammaproteobacteria bacterium]